MGNSLNNPDKPPEQSYTLQQTSEYSLKDPFLSI